MTTAERINKTLQQLPVSVQEEVLDFAEFLFEKTDKAANGRDSVTGLQKAESIELWAKAHSLETPVILDDRREIIYED
jgi:Protein of unknown function (DUF2281)